jgi:ParB-like chromosome segregation protein Spo0J
VIIAGHGRVEAARSLGLETVPTIRIEHLSDAQKRAYVLADNKLALNAGWDPEILAIEFQHLSGLDLEFDLEIPLRLPHVSVDRSPADELQAQ